jgi:ClpP class serine protease
MKVKYPLLIVRGGIYDNTLENIDLKLADVEGDILYLVIESRGGDPSVGYRIMRLLQAKYKKIISVVPNEAYSTATLMAIGTDEIYMRRSACLGPLDIQIEHPTDGSMISSLEIRDALNTLAGSLVTYSEDFYISAKKNLRLGKKDAAELSLKTATELMKPIAEKIDPIYLQISTRSSKLGQQYAEKLLVSRMMKTRARLARLVASYLANNYDYHGYAITLEEASELLALNVHDVTQLTEWEGVKTIYYKHKNDDLDGIAFEEFEMDIPDNNSQKPQETTKTASATIKSKGGGK